jgi:flagellar hook protein FlgE
MPSFSTALSGLNANSTALDVVGNNLANLNTQGFKSDNVLFKDVIGQTSGSTQIGAGVSTPSTAKQFTQGSIQTTLGILDAAIQGNGFFILRAGDGSTMYTRAGSFHVDSDGLLVTITGERVQGWSAVNGALNASGPVSDISVTALASQQPSATTEMTMALNLDAAAADGTSFSTPMAVVDSLGVTHVLTVTFTKTASNAWDYEVFIPGEELSGGTAGTPSSLGTGSLSFDANGQLTSPAAGSPVAVAATGLVSGANDLAIDWTLYKADGTPLITQYAQTSAVSGGSQNGIQAAQVTGMRLTDGGKLIASYSSGRQVTIAQIALASVGNPDSLVSAGNNNYSLGATSQTPAVGVPDTGNRGKVLGGAVETSNVDLAREFTNLIIYQRGYQANSKVISTLDQITQVLLNIRA